MGTREVNQATLDLIKSFEGIPDGDPSTVNLDPYLDPIGIWTIGWGHAISHGNDWLRGKENRKLAQSLYPGGITIAQAEVLLRADLMDAGKDVVAVVKVPLNDNQLGALVSFVFNLGLGNLKISTLLKMLNGGDYAAAADQLLRWNRAGGKVLAGLTRRREAERALFLA
ncbi:MAG: glycoside hydrolase family 24 [Nevskia sp.]|nr:glycoside hydrolase family 24 [Nevskia sp.]